MPKFTPDQLKALILGERNYQNTRYAHAGQRRTLSEHLTLFRVYLHRADEAWASNDGDGPAMDVVRKIAAIGTRCLEDLGIPGKELGDIASKLILPPQSSTEQVFDVVMEVLPDLTWQFDYDGPGVTDYLTLMTREMNENRVLIGDAWHFLDKDSLLDFLDQVLICTATAYRAILEKGAWSWPTFASVKAGPSETDSKDLGVKILHPEILLDPEVISPEIATDVVP